MYIVDSSTTVACFAANATFYSKASGSPYPNAWDNGLPRTLLGQMRAARPHRIRSSGTLARFSASRAKHAEIVAE